LSLTEFGRLPPRNIASTKQHLFDAARVTTFCACTGACAREIPYASVASWTGLEVVGWTERRCDPRNRRAQVLALTESAKPVVERAWEMGRNSSTEALKGATHDELHPLMDLLERVHANLWALAAEPVPAWRQGLHRNSLRTVG
jgi:hypothetical protein